MANHEWIFFAIFLLLCLRMASHLVGKCLKFDKISCRTFWYAILTTRWLWKVSVVKKSPKISEMANHEWIFSAIFELLCLRMALHLVGKCLKFDKISCRTFWYAILTTRWLWKVSVVKKSPKISEMAKKHPLFDGFLLPDRLPGLRYGLMGPRCDRLSKMSSTHSSGGGRGHIEASGAS